MIKGPFKTSGISDEQLAAMAEMVAESADQTTRRVRDVILRVEATLDEIQRRDRDPP